MSKKCTKAAITFEQEFGHDRRLVLVATDTTPGRGRWKQAALTVRVNNSRKALTREALPVEVGAVWGWKAGAKSLTINALLRNLLTEFIAQCKNAT